MRVGCASAAVFGTIPPFAARRKRGPGSVRGTDSGNAPICGSAARMRNGSFEGMKIRTSLVASDTTTRNCVRGMATTTMTTAATTTMAVRYRTVFHECLCEGVFMRSRARDAYPES